MLLLASPQVCQLQLEHCRTRTVFTSPWNPKDRPVVNTAFRLASDLAASLLSKGRFDLLQAPLSRIVEAFAEKSAGPGFASVRWDGRHFTFSANQAAVVRLLWEAWQAGTPDVHQSKLLEDTDSESKRLADLFKDHPAWGSLIVTTAKGVYRLNENPA